MLFLKKVDNKTPVRHVNEKYFLRSLDMQFAFLFLLICPLATHRVFSRWVGQRRLVNGTESENSYETIGTVLERVAGVFYNDSNRAEYGRNLDKTVVMTGCNHGFLNHLMNFKCFADRLGIKFLVVALDKKTHEFTSWCWCG